MPNPLEFILKLTDMLTPGMRQAAAVAESSGAKIQGRLEGINKVRFGSTVKNEFDTATQGAKRLENELARVEGRAKEVGSGGFLKQMLGFAGGNLIAGAVTDTAEWFKTGLEKAETKHQAIAQVNATLKSTGGAAGMDFAAVEEVAKGISKNARFSTTEMLKMQSVLLTFPEINKKIFGDTSQIIADLSTKMGQDLQSSAVQVGKAIQDPMHGVLALRRIGVNFNEQQTEVIKNLVENGHKAQAQMLILTELQKEFGGSARAAFDADPLIKFKKTMGALQTTIGEMGLALVGHLAAAFNSVASAVKDVVHWFEEYKTISIILGSIIGVVVTSLILYQTWTWIAVGATKAWAAVQWLLNESLLANPVTWIIIGIVALIAIIAGLVIAVKGWGVWWKHIVDFATAVWNSYADTFKLIWLGIQNTFLTGIELIEKGWFHLKSLWDKEGAKQGLAQINDQQNKRAQEIAAQAGVLKKDLVTAISAGKDVLTLKGLSIDKEGIAKVKTGLKKFLGLGVHHGEEGGGMVGAGAGGTLLDTKDKADKINQGGQRSIVINIGKQIEKLEVHVMSAKEGAQEIESAVRESLRRVLYSMNGAVTN